MNRICELLTADHVLLGVEASSKKRAFELAGLLFEEKKGIARSKVFDSLFARERLGSTGLGEGIAIPHGRIKGLKEADGRGGPTGRASGLRCPGRQARLSPDFSAGA